MKPENFKERLKWACDQCPLPGSVIPSLHHTRWYGTSHHGPDNVYWQPDGYTTTVFSSRLINWYRAFTLNPPSLPAALAFITISEWLPRYEPAKLRGWLTFGRNYTSAYVSLQENYLSDWSKQATRHLKKFKQTGSRLRLGTRHDVVELYRTSQVPKTMQIALLKILDHHLKVHPETIDILVAEKHGQATACFVAGNCDEINTSEYIIGAFEPSYKQDQAMTGLVDWWHQRSLERGYSWLTFGHMETASAWWVPMPSTGYSLFKTHFGIKRIWFPKNRWKISFNHTLIFPKKRT